nr:hypothetical protein [Tanacetum cinerariifolium]
MPVLCGIFGSERYAYPVVCGNFGWEEYAYPVLCSNFGSEGYTYPVLYGSLDQRGGASRGTKGGRVVRGVREGGRLRSPVGYS